MRNLGTIDQTAYQEILAIVALAQAREFKPLMFVIPVMPVLQMFKPVSIQLRANPLSEEYIVENLPRNFFDALEL